MPRQQSTTISDAAVRALFDRLESEKAAAGCNRHWDAPMKPSTAEVYVLFRRVVREWLQEQGIAMEAD